MPCLGCTRAHMCTLHIAVCIIIGGIPRAPPPEQPDCEGCCSVYPHWHTAEHNAPWALYVQSCREGAGAFTDSEDRRQRPEICCERHQHELLRDVTSARRNWRKNDVNTYTNAMYMCGRGLALADSHATGNVAAVYIRKRPRLEGALWKSPTDDAKRRPQGRAQVLQD